MQCTLGLDQFARFQHEGLKRTSTHHGLSIMASIGGPEVLIIIVVFFVLFGARRLPELANALGRSKGEFQKGLQEATSLPQEARTIADLEAGGMTPDVALVERAKALGLDPSGMNPDDLARKVEALEQAEE